MAHTTNVHGTGTTPLPASAGEQTRQDAIWNHFQNKRPELFSAAHGRSLFILNHVRRALGTPASGQPFHLLNIGVGDGTMERLAAEAGFTVYSLDPSAASISRIREELNLGDRAQAGYSQNLPFADGIFHAVTASAVLEHLTDEVLAASLAEIRRVIRPGGFFAGTTPAREDIAEQMVLCPECGHEFHRWGHHQSFDAARMRATLSPWFRVRTVQERPIPNWRHLNWKRKAKAAVMGTLWRMGLHANGERVFFLAERL